MFQDKTDRNVASALMTVMLLVMLVVGAAVGRASVKEPDLRDAKIGGAGQAWAVWTECGVGSAECDAILREVNGDDDGVSFFEDGSAYRTEDAPKYK